MLRKVRTWFRKSVLPSVDELEKLDKEDLYQHWKQINERFGRVNTDQNTKRMKEASGDYTTDNLLVAFLYLLIRDGTPPGRIEAILLSLSDWNDDQEITEHRLTNGWIAQYCEDVAMRIEHGWMSKKQYDVTEGL